VPEAGGAELGGVHAGGVQTGGVQTGGVQTGGPGRWLTGLAGLVALAVLATVAVLWLAGPEPEPTARPGPGVATPSGATTTDGAGVRTPPTPTRDEAVRALLSQRARAVATGDRAAFLATVDPTQAEFAAAQEQLIDRLSSVPIGAWTYEITGEGPGLPEARAGELPEGAAIVRVRLTYRLDGTSTTTDREQYLTVAPRGGRWLVAGDTDASESGLDTQRDLWDLGPVRVVRGDRTLVLADARGADRAELKRLAGEADRAVEDVDRLWRRDWAHGAVVLLPRTQKAMATLIGSDGDGLAQIAAVTTGSFEDGLARGDRIVINPSAFGTLGPMGRRVVLGHEMTHVATRVTSIRPVPIWLSEGFADYVAYDASPVPHSIVASDVLDDVRAGNGPRRLPEPADFDAGEGDVASAYEGAWLAARMVAERYGERRLVRLYEAMSDSAGPGWPEETRDVLGVGARQLTREWRAYLADKAGA
jgi:hypothetical protein